MAFAPVKSLVLLQLSALLLSSLSLSWAAPPQYHHGRPISFPPAPAPSPVYLLSPPYHLGRHPPTPPPSHSPPPVHPPPTKPPRYPPPKRSLIAVQGVVFCKSCKYSGSFDTLLGAAALPGAVVKLQCNNTRYPIVQEATTDKNGYFFIMAPKRVTTFGAHKCKVFLVSSPLATCNKPTNLHYGKEGALLKKLPVPPPPPSFELFTVGPFAFEPFTKCLS